MSIEAMKQALKAWDDYDGGTLDHPMSDAMEALRVAIKQAKQQEPVECMCGICKLGKRDWSLLEATQESLREHMAEIKRLKQRQWVGLSVNEARDFYESKLSRAELINKIDEFLEEKNSG